MSVKTGEDQNSWQYRIKFLRTRLVQLRNIEKESSEDDYLLFAKSWYGLLRETWERTVEERLFKGVIERFSLGIQTQKLKKVTITDDFLKDIETGMTESSNWFHDAGAGLNPTPPDSVKAEADLTFLDEFAKKCVSAWWKRKHDCPTKTIPNKGLSGKLKVNTSNENY